MQEFNLSQEKYWHAFNLIPELSIRNFQKILQYFPDLQTAWENAQKISALKKADLSAEKAKLINQKIRLINPDRAYEQLHQLNIKMLINQHPNYPYLLRQIYDPPPVLYYQGKITEPDEIAVAVVGTRKASFYGHKIIEEFIPSLVFHQITIVSGLAYGIDSFAHQETLKNNGRTIAVLGCGLDQIYPPENRRLAEQIKENGAIISEFPPGTEPCKFHFPQRNRIISGLSLGTLVVEAPEKSGALITAYQALDQNREVFAVPGSIFHDQSRGTNSIIQRNHAHVVLTAADLLQKLNEIPLFKTAPPSQTTSITQPSQPEPRPAEQKPLNRSHRTRSRRKASPKPPLARLSLEEKQVLSILKPEPLPFDQVLQKTSLSLPKVNSLLSLLELKGFIKTLPGNLYVRM